MIHPEQTHRRKTGSRLLAGALACAGLLLAGGSATADAQQQNGPRGWAVQTDNRNWFVQSDNAAAVGVFQQGKSFADAGQWEQAASAFDRFVAQYPKDRNVDAALFWLAYAHNRQGNPRAAVDPLSKLLQTYPKSRWADDAKALRVEVYSKLGMPLPAADEKDAQDDLRIIALKTLCENDHPSCASHANEVLRSSQSVRVKEAAYILLGRYGGAEAVPILVDRSRTETEEKLRMRAISALGSTNDERALDVLREIAMGATYADISPTDSAIHALAAHENPRAVAILGEVATRGQNPKARTHAIELLSRRRGDNVLDELLRLYDAVPDVQTKKYVVAGLGMRKDPRALNKLIEIARTAPDTQLRRQAIHSIPNRGDEQDLDVLLSLYDSERDVDLRDNLLSAIGQYQNQRAYQKLEQVVTNPAEPLDRRKAAIGYLSRSKDEGVKRFLEGLLK
ncbi:MAG: HEAT repeat domain-containing protein [Acidobacteria bacterium]|nr:HEAT repeat domain-containing protein [Acidobacteriota bacterium]